MRIQFYLSPTGRNPVSQYLDSLDDHEAAPIFAALRDIELHGIEGVDSTDSVHTVKCRVIAGKLWEIKVDRHRIFYVLVSGPTLVLLHACKKQGQKARKADLDRAKSRMNEILDSG